VVHRLSYSAGLCAGLGFALLEITERDTTTFVVALITKMWDMTINILTMNIRQLRIMLTVYETT
jgi:hypothetical protein